MSKSIRGTLQRIIRRDVFGIHSDPDLVKQVNKRVDQVMALLDQKIERLAAEVKALREERQTHK